MGTRTEFGGSVVSWRTPHLTAVSAGQDTTILPARAIPLPMMRNGPHVAVVDRTPAVGLLPRTNHVDLIHGYDHDWTGKALHLITGKTFLGLAHAQTIANRCAELLRV